MSGPYNGNEAAADDMARRLAGTSLPEEVAGVLHRYSMARATETLAIPGARAMPPLGWRVEADDMGGAMLLEEPAGAPPRLWAVMDAAGWLHALLDWKPEGLGHAWLRLPGGDGLEIQPGAFRNLLWGASDQLRHLTGPLDKPRSNIVGLLPAQPWERLETLPPFEFPARLPAGAGDAVLNLLARLMRLQGRQSARYRGPYPTAALFDSLGRCFRPSLPETEEDPPPDRVHVRARFSRDEMELAFRGEMVGNPIAWEPAPFAQLLPAPEVLVNLRDGVETVWIGRKSFRYRLWRNGLLAAGNAVWNETGEEELTYGVGLAMLGQPWRRFLTVGQNGGILASEIPPPAALDTTGPLADVWRPVVFCWAAVGASPALVAAILALEDTLPLHWAHLELCLARTAATRDGLLLNAAMGGRFLALKAEKEGMTAPGGAGESGALAMMMISDVLGELAPLVRGAAQRELALEPQHDPGRLIEQGTRLQGEARTRLERSLPQLVAALQRGEVLPPVPR